MARRGGRKSRKGRRSRKPRTPRKPRRGELPPTDWKRFTTKERTRHEALDLLPPPEHRSRKLSRLERHGARPPRPNHQQVVALTPPDDALSAALARVPREMPRHVRDLSRADLWWRNLTVRALPWRDDPVGWVRSSGTALWTLLASHGLLMAFLAMATAPWMAAALLAVTVPIALWLLWAQTSQQWRLLEEGHPRRAVIRRLEIPRGGMSRPALITYTFKDLSGRQLAVTERVAPEELGGELRTGTAIEVLVHPTIPGHVAPFLRGVAFEEGASDAPIEKNEPEPMLVDVGQIEDQRPATLPRPSWPVDAARLEDLRLRFDLFSSLPYGLARWLWFLLGPSPTGALTADSDGLRFQMDEQVVEIPWDKPPIIHATVRLMTEGMAELNLTLRARGALGRDEAISIKALVPQSQLSGRLDLKWETCASVLQGDMDTIWGILEAWSALHGQALEGYAPDVR